MYAEYRTLRWIDNRSGKHRAEDSTVGNRECAAGQFLDSELAILRALAEISDVFFDFSERQLIGVADDGHHQPARRAHGDADIKVAVIDDIIAINRSVDDGEFLECRNRRLDEKRHETEFYAVFFLKTFLVAVTQLDYRLHVDFVESGQYCRRMLRLHQALGDAHAQPSHRHALLRAIPRDGGDIDRGRFGSPCHRFLHGFLV